MKRVMTQRNTKKRIGSVSDLTPSGESRDCMNGMAPFSRFTFVDLYI